ncbi:MAG: hypothetical protein ACKOU7_02245 [Ferruginibacter sp.]
MKKVILALAIVSVSFAACNNNEKKEEATPAADTTKVEAPAPVDTTKAPVADTTKKK